MPNTTATRESIDAEPNHAELFHKINGTAIGVGPGSAVTALNRITTS